MPPQLTAEDRLCLLLSRGQLNPDEQALARELLAAPLHWPRLMEQSHMHQVFPLVYGNLRQLEFASVPAEVEAELKGAYQANALRNQLRSEELASLLYRLGDAGIPTIPLKGVPLAESLFADPAARVSDDIDLLVRPDKLRDAIAVIRSSGYPDVFQDAFFRQLALRHGRHYEFQREDRHSTLIELHWRLVQFSSGNDAAVADLWQEARPTSFRGAPAFAFSCDWEFLYLAIHAADHRWRLKWLVDFHQFCRVCPPHWKRITEKAEKFEFDRIVHRTIAAANLLLGMPLPEGAAPFHFPPKTRLFPQDPRAGSPTEAALFPMSLLQRTGDRLRCALNIMLVPKPADRDFVRLRGPLSFLYYPVRVLRLITRRV